MTVQAGCSQRGDEFRYGSTSLTDAIVALSPGATQSVSSIDLHPAGGRVTEPAAIGELFASHSSLNLVAASRRFYQSHADNYDQLVFWTDTTVMTDAFAFQSMVKNAITGIGRGLRSRGRARQRRIAPERNQHGSHLEVCGSARGEVVRGKAARSASSRMRPGHRWLARLEFLDVNRTASDQLLGRQRAHGAFSPTPTGRSWRATRSRISAAAYPEASATEKYSRLDLYAMGLATEAEVPSWFYVEAPISSHAGKASGGGRIITAPAAMCDPGQWSTRSARACRRPPIRRVCIGRLYFFVRRASATLDPQDLTRLGASGSSRPILQSRTENRMTVRTTLAP